MKYNLLRLLVVLCTPLLGVSCKSQPAHDASAKADESNVPVLFLSVKGGFTLARKNSKTATLSFDIVCKSDDSCLIDTQIVPSKPNTMGVTPDKGEKMTLARMRCAGCFNIAGRSGDFDMSIGIEKSQIKDISYSGTIANSVFGDVVLAGEDARATSATAKTEAGGDKVLCGILPPSDFDNLAGIGLTRCFVVSVEKPCTDAGLKAAGEKNIPSWRMVTVSGSQALTCDNVKASLENKSAILAVVSDEDRRQEISSSPPPMAAEKKNDPSCNDKIAECFKQQWEPSISKAETSCAKDGASGKEYFKCMYCACNKKDEKLKECAANLSCQPIYENTCKRWLIGNDIAEMSKQDCDFYDSSTPMESENAVDDAQ